MSVCMTQAEFKRRTYIKHIGEIEMSCDRILHMGDETEISPEEEAEALGILHEVLEVLKKHLYLHSLRRAAPIHVETKRKKVILFVPSAAYWDAWEAELVRRDQEEDEREAAEEAAKLAQLEQKEK